MRLIEEAQKLRAQIENPSADGQPDSSELRDISELRAIVREGVFEFEELLKALPDDQQEAAHILYLQKVREITCAMHMAVDSLVHKYQLGNNSPDEKMSADDPHVVPSWHYFAHLYQF